MQKAEIRKIFRAQRMSLAPDVYEAHNRAICELFFEWVDLSSVRSVHCYLPVLTRNEVNTFLIIEQLLERNAQIGIQVPKVWEGNMLSISYTKEMVLEPNGFGVLEPQDLSPALQVPDLVITPLLAFDPQGYRVGYGGGYYDKYFATLPANVIKVGLSFFPSIDLIDDLDEFDMPLDLCITPKKVYEFKYGY